MYVYCNARDCRWNEEGQCQGKEHPFYEIKEICLEQTFFGIVCTDYEEREEEG